MISAFNSLTLSPALAALLLKPHDAPKDWLTRGMDRVFGGFFRRFNSCLHRGSDSYGKRRDGRAQPQGADDGRVCRAAASARCCMCKVVPAGFVPAQDKEYLIGFAQLPNGASLDRTDAVIRQMSRHRAKQPGVESAVRVPGPVDQRLHQLRRTRASCSSTLKPFDERARPRR